MDNAIFLQLFILLFSIIAHEYAHGAVAYQFGDDTARLMGRLTLNPLPHIDPIGSVLLPFFCFFTHAPIFGWAKPVPVSYHRLNNPRYSFLMVSAVGPCVNLALGCIFALLLRFNRSWLEGTSFYYLLSEISHYAILINLYLFVFNLLPLYPLDGSRVLASLLPAKWSREFERLEPYGFILIVLMLFTGAFGWIVSPPVFMLYQLLVS